MLRLVQNVSGHKGKVWSAAWDCEGNKLATCGEDKIAKLWCRKTGSSAENVDSEWISFTKCGDNHQRTIRDVAWSPCGKFIGLASFDATVTLWEKQSDGTYECVSTVEGHENEVKSICWSPSGEFFSTCGRDKNVMVWSMNEEDDYEVQCDSVLTVHTQDVKRVAWHPKEDVLVSSSYDDTIKIYKNDLDGGDWTNFATLDGHESTVWAIDFDKTGNRLASCSDDKTVKIWQKTEDETKWLCTATLSGYHSRAIYDISWNKHNGLIATACADDNIRIFKESTGNELEKNNWELVTTVKAHDADVNRVKWNPRISTLLVSVGDDGAIKFWNLEGLLLST